MKNRVLAAAAALLVALSVGTLVTPGIAAASDADYLYDLRTAGIGGSDDALLSLGRTACDEKDGGKPHDKHPYEKRYFAHFCSSLLPWTYAFGAQFAS